MNPASGTLGCGARRACMHVFSSRIAFADISLSSRPDVPLRYAGAPLHRSAGVSRYTQVRRQIRTHPILGKCTSAQAHTHEGRAPRRHVPQRYSRTHFDPHLPVLRHRPHSSVSFGIWTLQSRIARLNGEAGLGADLSTALSNLSSRVQISQARPRPGSRTRPSC